MITIVSLNHFSIKAESDDEAKASEAEKQKECNPG